MDSLLEVILAAEVLTNLQFPLRATQESFLGKEVVLSTSRTDSLVTSACGKAKHKGPQANNGVEECS